MSSPIDYIRALSNEQQNGNIGTELLTEDYVAKEFTRRNGNGILFCHTTGKWHRWSGTAWIPDRTESVFHLIREHVREVACNQLPKIRKGLSKASFTANVEKFCRNDPQIAVTADRFDANPWMLGTPHGTVDLRTGLMRYADPEDYISKLTTASPTKTADCPRWLQFLQETTGSDFALIRFLQQWCGYCLTGVTREHALLFVYGSGGNGKSVFLNVLTGILGEYAKTAAMDSLTASNSDKHPTDLAMLQGARLVTASETEEGRPWAEAKIKSLTGGDPITARYMRQDYFTYKPKFKLTIVGNHQPTLRNIDDAARRRFNLVPFTRKPQQPDQQLEDKLRAEWPAILRWMIEGCLDWQKCGLVRPAAVVDATETYFAEQDLLGQWLAEHCDLCPGDRSLWVPTRALHASYSRFVQAAGDTPSTLRTFVASMQQKGLQYYRTAQARGFHGIRLR